MLHRIDSIYGSSVSCDSSSTGRKTPQEVKPPRIFSQVGVQQLLYSVHSGPAVVQNTPDPGEFRTPEYYRILTPIELTCLISQKDDAVGLHERLIN